MISHLRAGAGGFAGRQFQSYLLPYGLRGFPKRGRGDFTFSVIREPLEAARAAYLEVSRRRPAAPAHRLSDRGACGDEDGRKEVGVGGAVGQPELEPGRVRDPVAGRCFDLDFKALTRVATPGGRVCVLWDHVGPCVAVCARGRGYSLVLPAMGDCSELAVPTGPCGCGCSRCTRCSSGPRTRRRQSVHCSTAATDTTGCLLGCLAPLTGRARGQRLLQGQQWKKEKRGAMSGGGSA